MLVVAACRPNGANAVKAEAIRRGDELVGKRQYAQAADEYRSVVELDPGDGQARMKLAKAYSLAQNYAQASAEAIRAADQLPGDVDAQALAAAMMLTQARYVDAADRMTAVLREHPEDVNTLILWGNATAHLYNSMSALYTLADAVRDADTFAGARRELRSWISPADEAAAEKAFRKALNLAPTLLEAQLAIANDLWATGRLDESLELLTRIADDHRDNEIVNYALGQLEFARDRPADGELHLQNVVSVGGALAPRARLALADYYVATKRDREARAMLEPMATVANVTPDVTVRLAADDFRSGKPGDAVRRLDALLVRAPRNTAALVLKAQILFDMGNPDLRYARAAVAEGAMSGDAHAALGQALAAAGQEEDAYAEYMQAVRFNPNAKQPRLALARLALALERGPEALQYARDAVRLDPTDETAAVVLLKALVMEREYSMAESALKPLLERHPDAPDLLVASGMIEAARGSEGAARAAFGRALQQDPHSFDALSGLASLEIKQPTPATVARIEAAIATHPRDGRYLLLAARFYTAAQDMGHAEARLRQAVELDRGDVRAGRALADFLIHARRADEAVGVLRQLVERRADSVDAKTTLAVLLDDTGKTKEAQALYERIIDQDPKAAIASYRLAALYANQGRNLDTALGLAVVAKQQRLTDPAVSDTVGWIYTLKNLPELALPQLQEAVAASPNNALYHYHLGSAYQRGGALASASSEFLKALQIDSNFPYADAARKALAAIKK